MTKSAAFLSLSLGLACSALATGCDVNMQMGLRPTPATAVITPTPSAANTTQTTTASGTSIRPARTGRPSKPTVSLPWERSSTANNGSSSSSTTVTLPNVTQPSSASTTTATSTTQTNPTAFGSLSDTGGAYVGDMFLLSSGQTKIPDLNALKPVATLYLNKFDINTAIAQGASSSYFAFEYQGALEVTTEADYELRLVSDDGSKLFIDDMLVIDNDGVKEKPESKTQKVHLVKAVHLVKLQYLQAGGASATLQLYVKPQGTAEMLLTGQL